MADHELNTEPASIVVHVASVAGGALIGAATWGLLSGAGKWAAQTVRGKHETDVDRGCAP